jgi:hypothetical protein
MVCCIKSCPRFRNGFINAGDVQGLLYHDIRWLWYIESRLNTALSDY